MSEVDFGRTAADYARHRAGFPPVLGERLAALGVLRGRALDLGTGTGTLARLLAGHGLRVVGLDPARAMLLAAPPPVVVARAEATPFADASFDLVTAGQCWHWFDRPRAAREARRLLRPGGALVVAHYDWLPLPGNVVEATEDLILAHNPAWTGSRHTALSSGTGLYPAWLADLALAGLEGLETFSVDVPAVYSHEGWAGRIRASAGVAASLPPDAVARFDAEHRALLRARFPHEPLVVPHRLWAAVGRLGA